MPRRHSHSYYEFWRQFRERLKDRLIPPTLREPYIQASRVYTGSAPTLRLHARAVEDLLQLYELLRTVQELATAAAESVRVYITTVLGYEELKQELVKTSRSVASRFNQVVRNDNILGVLVG